MKRTAGKVYQTSVFVSNKVAQVRALYIARFWLLAVILIYFSVAVSLTACV